MLWLAIYSSYRRNVNTNACQFRVSERRNPGLHLFHLTVHLVCWAININADAQKDGEQCGSNIWLFRLWINIQELYKYLIYEWSYKDKAHSKWLLYSQLPAHFTWDFVGKSRSPHSHTFSIYFIYLYLSFQILLRKATSMPTSSYCSCSRAFALKWFLQMAPLPPLHTWAVVYTCVVCPVWWDCSILVLLI